MVFIRIFKIFFVLPFHPMLGFGLYQDDPRQQLLRRLAFWLFFVLEMTLLHFMIYQNPQLFNDPPFLAWLYAVMVKFFGLFMFFFIFGVTGMMAKLNEQMGYPIHLITALISFTFLPEFIFVIGAYFYPAYYEEIRFLCHVWRTVLIVLGTYIITNGPMKSCIITGVISSLCLYFANYNFFAAVAS